MKNENCLFCKIAEGKVESHIVFDDEISLAFLDHRPLFHGHCLLIPKYHCETLPDLPQNLILPLITNTQILVKAIENGLNAEGTFVAINNRVSQSVPHLHLHIVPRRKGDGLKGFFWPRQPYKSDDEILKVQNAIRSAIQEMKED